MDGQNDSEQLPESLVFFFVALVAVLLITIVAYSHEISTIPSFLQ